MTINIFFGSIMGLFQETIIHKIQEKINLRQKCNYTQTELISELITEIEIDMDTSNIVYLLRLSHLINDMKTAVRE